MKKYSLSLCLSYPEATALPLPNKRQLKKEFKTFISTLSLNYPMPKKIHLHYVFVDDEEFSRTLNLKHRGKDKSTNILTFTYQCADSHLLKADFVLCLPVIQREAKESHKSLRAHLYHLIIHGLLHSLGYDHESSQEEAEQMEELEKTLLALLSIADPYEDQQSIET